MELASMRDADVVVAGAGPVGLTLAIDLAGRGVRVLLVESRQYAEPPNVKCNHVAARTMEQFRRLGIAQLVRDAGLPADYPNDVVFRTAVTGFELTRIAIPCRAERFTATGGPDTWWPTPEPPHRINQLFLEPILLTHAASLSNVRLLNRTQVTGYTQTISGSPQDSHVEVRIRDFETGQESTLRARYLVGCDGGSSTVRKVMGSKLQGTPIVQRVQSTFIRAPHLSALIPGKRAWSYYSVNPRRCGTMFAINGRDTWLIHNHLNPHEPEFDSVDRDSAIRNILGVGAEFEYEVISKEDWVGRRLLANRFRDRNVFIAGDAAHLWVPYAGFGMNAGIADAVNLAWLLSARLQGWAGEGILNAYEAERQPITEQVSQFAMEHAQKMIKARQAVDERIEEVGAVGDALRTAAGDEAYRLNVNQFCCAGLNFGYYYENSPIIIGDDELAPPYSMGAFTPSSVPGCRAPHFWMPDGRSVYDCFGPGYTLLRFDGATADLRLVEAAHRRAVPLKVVQVPGGAAPEAYRHRLVLCRSDHQVVWRSNEEPADADALLSLLSGVPSSG
jgi:2-polyprenyl-6-methoxyphenol hydroxylase-like FAD-dependent oxidoreductase